MYKSYWDTVSTPIRLADFVYNHDYDNQIDRIREMSDKAERDAAKAALPCIMVSCVSENRNAGKHTGLICIDIDGKDNPEITDWPKFIRHDLRKLEIIAYAGLSVSGQGCFAIIPISYPSRHEAHFKALQEDFSRCGINIDPSGKNVNRLRGQSSNNPVTSFCNPIATRYSRTANSGTVKSWQKPTGLDAIKVQEVVDKIVAEKRDVTKNYHDWVRIAQALATTFGEKGRNFFHEVSQFYPRYDSVKADEKFSSFLGKGYSKLGLGTFFKICSSNRDRKNVSKGM